ncbi:peptidoglycan-binding domain-containing protein [Streptomyces koyangensis]|uniref:peptidoglycan-binding domain-containing protein n=1 Tax=Streptomyces koyangensis TaxID=188770 RepID=UPI003BF51A6D
MTRGRQDGERTTMTRRVRGWAVAGVSALLLAGAATAAGPAAAAAGEQEQEGLGVAAASCTKTKKVYWGTPAASLPVSSGGSVNCLLGPGSSGSAVKALQHALARCHKVNLGAGGVDGIYGERTRAGVLAVQRAAGIAQDGVYGLQTQQSMNWDFQGGGQRFCGNIYVTP